MTTSKNKLTIQEEWNSKGEDYAKSINEMVEFAKKNGWENWKGKEAKDKRGHLAKEVIRLLKQANCENNVEQFRNDFPPSHAPLVSLLEKYSQSIEQLHFIDNQRIVFVAGASYSKRQAYLLDNDEAVALDNNINAIGKSLQNNIFAIATDSKISTYRGWEGELIAEFTFSKTVQCGITELIPFNDGNKVLIISSEGIYLLTKDGDKLLHPLNEENEDDWFPHTDMGNGALSNDNAYIVVGDQFSDHRILDFNGNTIGNIRPESSYPHFCLFSKDDKQLITNSFISIMV
jgi:hypothetical protein